MKGTAILTAIPGGIILIILAIKGFGPKRLGDWTGKEASWEVVRDDELLVPE